MSDTTSLWLELFQTVAGINMIVNSGQHEQCIALVILLQVLTISFVSVQADAQQGTQPLFRVQIWQPDF